VAPPAPGYVPDVHMCGVTTNKAFLVSEKWRSLLLEALTGIPDVKAGGEEFCTSLPRRGASATSGTQWLPAGPS
jgi:hypothetical protein